MCRIFYHDRRPCQEKRDLSLASATSPKGVKTAAAISVGSTASRRGLRIERHPTGEPSGEITPEAREPLERGASDDGVGIPFLYGFLSGELQRRAEQENGEST